MKRYWPQQLHIVAASLIFLSVLTLVYLIAVRHNHRLDLTRDKIHSVSNETLEVLNRMKAGEIRVRSFFAGEDPARRDLEILLKEIATHHRHFRYRFFDPDRSPSEARRYRVDSYRTTVIEYQKREERTQDFTEEGLANTLIRLAHPQKRTICFTTGHGEIDLADPERTGLAGWKQILENHQHQIKEIQILEKEIPEECSAVVMAGPRYELLPRELDLLQKYPEKGKGLLLLIDPMDPGTGRSFNELLRPFGLKPGEDVVVDKLSRVFGGDYLVPLVSQYADHPITRQFRVAVFLPISRTVRKTSDAPLGLKITELATTTAGSWAETNLKKLEEGEAELDPETDLVGPVSLAAAVEMLEAVKGARVVVVGDSDFVTNAHLNVSGNKDFALNILQWLVKDDRWISIRAKESRFEPFFLKVNQSVGAAVFSIGGLPLTALLLGSAGIWVRRRHSH